MNDTLTLGREEMLSKLADADDDFATWLLSESSSNNSNSNAIINGCLRKNTLSLNIVPVVCGSALRFSFTHSFFCTGLIIFAYGIVLFCNSHITF